MAKKISPSTIPPAPTSHIASLVKAYLTKRSITTLPDGSVDWDPLNKYKDFYTLTTNSAKADRLMKIYSSKKHPNGNPHFWFLIAFSASRTIAISNLSTNKPWSNITLAKYSDFETWRNDIENCLNKLQGIKDLVWYDVALILAYLLNQKLLPKDKVYVHALPLKAMTCIYNYLGISKSTIKTIHKNLNFYHSTAPSCLSLLNAYQMEDFFCIVGHAMKKYKVGVAGLTPHMITSII